MPPTVGQLHTRLARLERLLQIGIGHKKGSITPDPRSREAIFFEDIGEGIAKIAVRFGPNIYIFESTEESLSGFVPLHIDTKVPTPPGSLAFLMVDRSSSSKGARFYVNLPNGSGVWDWRHIGDAPV